MKLFEAPIGLDDGWSFCDLGSAISRASAHLRNQPQINLISANPSSTTHLITMTKLALIALIPMACVLVVCGDTDAPAKLIEHFPPNYLVTEKYKMALREVRLNPSNPDSTLLSFFAIREKYPDFYNALNLLVHPDVRLEYKHHGRLSFELEFYRNMKNFYHELKRKPEGAMFRKVKQVIEFLDERSEGKFRDYFQRDRLGRSNITEALKLISPEDETAFDEIVIEGYDLSPKVKDAKLFDKAKAFQFEDESLSLSRITKLAGQFGTRDEIEALKDLFRTRCSPIQGMLKDEFNIYNVAKTINSGPLAKVLDKVPLRFKKLNEYNRICFLWDDLSSITNLVDDSRSNAYV